MGPGLPYLHGPIQGQEGVPREDTTEDLEDARDQTCGNLPLLWFDTHAMQRKRDEVGEDG